jgi:hypothetical protein
MFVSVTTYEDESKITIDKYVNIFVLSSKEVRISVSKAEIKALQKQIAALLESDNEN